MQTYINQLAEELHNRDNPKQIGVSIGEVINLNPIRVRICGGAVELEEGTEAYVCEKLKDRDYTVDITGNITINSVGGKLVQNVSGSCSSGGTVTGSLTGSTSGKLTGSFKGTGMTQHIYSNLDIGDHVLCVPDATEQMWIIVDKVVGVE